MGNLLYSQRFKNNYQIVSSKLDSDLRGTVLILRKLMKKIKRLPNYLKRIVVRPSLKQSKLVRKIATLSFVPGNYLLNTLRFHLGGKKDLSNTAHKTPLHLSVNTQHLWDPVSINKNQVGDASVVSQPIEKGGLTTVDFWDTLVLRVRPAEGVKRLTALRQSWHFWLEQQLSEMKTSARELHHRRIAEEATLVNETGEAEIRKALKLTGLDSICVEQVASQEIQDEITYSATAQEVIGFIKENVGQVTVVSDHYLQSSDLKTIAENLGFSGILSELYSSADIGKTKRKDGELFQFLELEKEQNWVHVGDNPVSDIANAEKHGARALLVERKFNSAWNEHELDFKKLADELPAHLLASNSARYLVSLSAVAFGLITFAIEKAIAEGKTQIAYLSREGEVLVRAHEVAAKYIQELGGPYVKGLHLPVSRASSVFPAGSLSVGNLLEALGQQYPSMTAADFHSSAGLPVQFLERIKSDLGPLTTLQPNQLWELLSEKLQDDILKYLEEQRLLLSELLSNLNINPSNTVLCDLGWRGSINDALNQIAQKEFTGAYLGLYNSYNFIGNYSRKFGLLYDEPRGFQPATNPEFLGHIEKSFTISSHQVARYERGKDGQVIPLTIDKSDGPSADRLQVMNHFEDIMNATAEAMFSVGAVGSDSAEFVWEIFVNWTQSPTRQQASTWYLEHHSEGFGTVDSVSTLEQIDYEVENNIVDGFVTLDISDLPWPSGLQALISEDKGTTNG